MSQSEKGKVVPSEVSQYILSSEDILKSNEEVTLTTTRLFMNREKEMEIIPHDTVTKAVLHHEKTYKLPLWVYPVAILFVVAIWSPLYYWGALYPINSLWIIPVPLTIGLVIFFAIYYNNRRKNKSQPQYVLLHLNDQSNVKIQSEVNEEFKKTILKVIGNQ